MDKGLKCIRIERISKKEQKDVKKSTKIILWIVGSAAFLAMLILGSIYDLQISKTLASLPDHSYYTTNKLAQVVDTVGETVLYIIVDIALIIIFHRYKNIKMDKKWLRILFMIGSILLAVVVTAYAIYKIVGYLVIYTELKPFLYSTLGLLLLIVLGAALLLGIFCIISLLKETTIEKLFKWAIAVLIVAAVSNGIAQALKFIVARTRYRAIMNESLDPETYFTPWYMINKNKFASTAAQYGDYFKSFPSGHCCAAASMFLFCLLPCYVESTRDTLFYILAPAVCTVYTLLVMLSRIIAGAHYFTDTLIGAGITIACILVYKAIFIKNKPIASKEVKEETPQQAETA